MKGTIKAGLLGALSALAVVGGATATHRHEAALEAPGLEACTPAQAAAAVQLTVDTCSEIANFVPPTGTVGSVVGLLCQTVDQLAPAVQVIVDSNIWNSLKAQYAAAHGGVLPKGMSPVPLSYPTAAVPLPDAKKP